MKIVSIREYVLFGEAWLLLAFARALLLVRPFRKIAPLLGKAMQEAPSNTIRQLALQKQITLAILRAARFSPWRTKCFEQAIAAKIMLRRRHIYSTVYFGVFRDASDEMRAHAWVKINDVIVTGGPSTDHITIISWFGS